MSEELATESRELDSQAIANDIVEQAKQSIVDQDTNALTVQLIRTWREGFADGMEQAASIIDSMAASDSFPEEFLPWLSALSMTIRESEARAPRVQLPDPNPKTTITD